MCAPRPVRVAPTRTWSWTLAALTSLASTGCPLSDDYFIEASSDGASTTAGGSNSSSTTDTGKTQGNTATGGAGGSSTSSTEGSSGASNSTVGSTGTGGSTSGGAGGTGGTGGNGGTGGGSVAAPCTRCFPGDDCDPACETGWAVMAEPPSSFEARELAAYAANDTQLFVWGGRDSNGTPLKTGALYDVPTDTWTEVPLDDDTPSARHSATAVWTGSVFVVWGGIDSSAFADGALYDPETERWSSISDASRARGLADGAYLSYSDRVYFWGGVTETNNLLEGMNIYNPEADSWVEGDTTSDPGKLANAAWTARDFTLWVIGGLKDGSQPTGEAFYYSTSSERWISVGGPSGNPTRWGSFAAFLGSTSATLYSWGGADSDGAQNNGWAYSVGSGSWRSMTSTDAPSHRYASTRESGWTFAIDDEIMAVLGGLDDSDRYLRDGGTYREATGWKAIEAWPTSADHAFGAAAYVGDEIVVWGGWDGDTLTKSGVRYLP